MPVPTQEGNRTTRQPSIACGKGKAVRSHLTQAMAPQGYLKEQAQGDTYGARPFKHAESNLFNIHFYTFKYMDGTGVSYYLRSLVAWPAHITYSNAITVFLRDALDWFRNYLPSSKHGKSYIYSCFSHQNIHLEGIAFVPDCTGKHVAHLKFWSKYCSTRCFSKARDHLSYWPNCAVAASQPIGHVSMLRVGQGSQETLGGDLSMEATAHPNSLRTQSPVNSYMFHSLHSAVAESQPFGHVSKFSCS